MNKNTSIIIILVLIIALGLIFWSSSNNPEDMNGEINQEQTVIGEDGVEDMIVENDGSAAGSTEEAMSYTLADVATHATPEDCWTTINEGVYDLTAWINAHPGGDKAILRLCGIDGTEPFNEHHGGQENPLATLAGFQVGVLVN